MWCGASPLATKTRAFRTAPSIHRSLYILDAFVAAGNYGPLFVAHLLFRKGKVSAVQYLLGVPSPRRIVSELSSSNQEEK
jgi:hypothetical protein